MRSIEIVSICMKIIIYTPFKPIPSIIIILLVKEILKHKITAHCKMKLQ